MTTGKFKAGDSKKKLLKIGKYGYNKSVVRESIASARSSGQRPYFKRGFSKEFNFTCRFCGVIIDYLRG
ncbi:MAG TPA: hypothetical protein DEQ14_03360 [Treponema sp.]|nr:hypothetical protein [Treponema sp.]